MRFRNFLLKEDAAMPPMGGPGGAPPPMGGGMPGAGAPPGGMLPAGGAMGMPGGDMGMGGPPAAAPASGALPTPTLPKHADVWEALDAVLKGKKTPDQEERQKLFSKSQDQQSPAQPAPPPGMPGMPGAPPAPMGGPPQDAGLMGL